MARNWKLDFLEGQFDDAPESFDTAREVPTSIQLRKVNAGIDTHSPDKLSHPAETTNRLLDLSNDLNGFGQFDDAPEPSYWSIESRRSASLKNNDCGHYENYLTTQDNVSPDSNKFHVFASQDGCKGFSKTSPQMIDGLTDCRKRNLSLSHAPLNIAQTIPKVATRRSPPKLPIKHGRASEDNMRTHSVEKVSHFEVVATSSASDAVEGFVAAETIYVEDHDRRFPIDDENVTVRDVLFGRGGKTNTHPGNVHYRTLVSKYRVAYQTSKKNNKHALSKNLVHFIRSQNGRFLKRSGSDIFWYEVGDEKAIAKTGQALREGMAEIIRSSLQRKDPEAKFDELVKENSAELQRQELELLSGRKRQKILTKF